MNFYAINFVGFTTMVLVLLTIMLSIDFLFSWYFLWGPPHQGKT